MLNHMNLEQEPPFSALFLTELELSDDASLLRPATKAAAKDMVLGAGGSALAHILLAIAVLLMPFVQLPPALHGTFVTVSLVEMGGSKGGSCDTGRVEGAYGRAPDRGTSSPRGKTAGEGCPTGSA